MKAQKVILDLTALIVFGDGRWMGCLKIIRKIENVDSLKLYISMKFKHCNEGRYTFLDYKLNTYSHKNLHHYVSLHCAIP